MKIKSKCHIVKNFLFILVIVSFSNLSHGQLSPPFPISHKIFTPFLFNPAITGSKDFLSVDFIGSSLGKSNSQVLSANTRLSKKTPGYFSSPSDSKFLNIGIGGSLFNVNSGSSRNTGLSASFSYQIPMDKQSLSFLSIGASFKGTFHQYSGNKDLSIPSKSFFYPNMDLGLYYYRSDLFVGISTTDFLGSPKESDSLNSIPVTRQYIFLAGYKLILSRSLNLVLEPSIFIETDDSLTFDLKKNIKPVLKLYFGNFCIGTYFNDYSKNSVFFQFRFPKFYLGTFFEIPKNSAFYKNSMTAEFALGVNFSGKKSGSKINNHW
jgi:type IX secretion system PorP/SprF family membrane protein